ncbi:MAG: shikimate kinase AroK [Gammaproteobacteria bacterium]
MKTHTSIFLIGPMGAGKTTIGRYLAQALQRDFYDSDREIEQRTGVTIPWIFDIEGEVGFRKREEIVIDELSQIPGIVLATGGGAMLSPLTQEKLTARGTVIYLTVPLLEQQERVLRNQNRPLLYTQDLTDTLKKLQKEREAIYQSLADYTFCTSSDAPQTVMQQILAEIQLTTAI